MVAPHTSAYDQSTLREMFDIVNSLMPAFVTALEPVAPNITERSAAFDVPFPYGELTHRMNIAVVLVGYDTPQARYQVTVTAKNNLLAFRCNGMVAVINRALSDTPGFQAGIIHLDGGNSVSFAVDVIPGPANTWPYDAVRRHVATALQDVLIAAEEYRAGVFTHNFNTVVDYHVRRDDHLWSVMHTPRYESGSVVGYMVRVTYVSVRPKDDHAKEFMALAAKLLLQVGYTVTKQEGNDVWGEYKLARRFKPNRQA